MITRPIRLTESSLPYLTTLIASIVLGRFAQYLWQYVWTDIPTILGHSPEIYIKLILTPVTAVLWLFCRRERTRDPWLGSFFALLAATWLAFWILSAVHGDATTFDGLLYLTIIFGLYWKTPSTTDLIAGLKVLGWLLVIVLVVTRTAEITGLFPEIYVGKDILAFEVNHYWLPLSGTLGPEGRWPGPIGHNAMTGNVAAMLIVLGFGLRGRSRWVFAIVGILVLLLTASRGSQMGAIAGVALLAATTDNLVTRRVKPLLTWSGLGLLTGLAVAYTLVKNPSLTGRTTFWARSLEVWQTSPFIGVGTSGMRASEASIAGFNAHNLVIDALIKGGLLGGGLVAGLLLVALVLAVRTARRGSPLAVAIIGTYLVIGLTESDHGWSTTNLPWAWLILGALLASQAKKQPPDGSIAVPAARYRTH